MKSFVFTIVTFAALAALAITEVPYDQNDAIPADHMRYSFEIRTKDFTHSNGQTYAVMYGVQKNQMGQADTKVLRVCNIGYKDSMERCLQDQDPILAQVHAAVIKANKPDCSKIALLNQDHRTTSTRIAEYNSTNRQRSDEDNIRLLSPIAASLVFQVETLNSFVPAPNYAESVTATKQLMDDIANKRMSPYESLVYLVRRVSGMRRDYADLLKATRCTPQEQQLCRFSKETGEMLTPEANMDQYNKYIALERKGLIEMRACMSATVATPEIKAPVVTEPVITTPAIREEQQLPVDPTIAK